MEKRGIIFLLGSCFALLGIDFLAKMYTYHHVAPLCFSSPLYPYGGIPVFQDWFGIDFSINYAMNKGAAWGVFSQFQHLLLWTRFGIVAFLLVYLSFAKISLSRRCAFACIATGAIGNICDFFLYGHVVDMLHFRFWGYAFPVFNIADSLIFCGVVFLLATNASRKAC